MLGCHQRTEPQGKGSPDRAWQAEHGAELGVYLKAQGSRGSAEPEKHPSGCSVGLWSEVRWELSAEASKGEQSWSRPTSLLTGFLP